MNIQFIKVGRQVHDAVQELLIQGLRNKGHKVIIVNSENIISDSTVDATISYVPNNFESNQLDFKNPTKPWIRLEHGIYFYKQWARWVCYDLFDLFLMPTQYPIDFYYKNYKYFSKEWCKHTVNHVQFTKVDGWGKLDVYYKYSKDRIKTRQEIYQQFHLDSNRPLVLYAPTWVRDKGTKFAWLQEGLHPDAYINQGSGYLSNEVIKQVQKLPVNLLCLPHFVGTQSNKLKNLDLDTRVKLMVAADLLVGDISSMVAEFTVLDKPIVLIKKDIKDRSILDFHIYQDLRTPVLDVGDIIDVSEVAKVVKYRLKHDDYKERRNMWKNKLVIPDGKFDGHCTDREVTAIETFIKEYKASHE